MLVAAEDIQIDSGSKTVLVVEDEVALRFVIATLLREDGGFTVVEAQNADEAMLYLKSGHRVDFLFTDVRMPGSFDGVELTRRVRVMYPHLKVMMTSGNLLQQERITGVPLVVKPYDVVQVLAQISAALTEDTDPTDERTDR